MNHVAETTGRLQWVHLESVHQLQHPLALEGCGALGSLLRSVLGLALHQLAPESAALFMGGGDDTDQTRPWWMWPQEPVNQAQFNAGDEMRVRWSLCVSALPHLPALAQALNSVGRLGLGPRRAKAVLLSLEVLSPQGPLPLIQADHASARWDAGLLWQWAVLEAQQVMHSLHHLDRSTTAYLWVSAHTPMRIKRAGALVAQAPALSALVSATMGRLDALRRHLPPQDCARNQDPGNDWLQRQLWLQWADRWEPVEDMTGEVAVARWSSRQRRSMILPGLQGTWAYDLEVALALPWLRLAEHLQLGGKTSFGMGTLQVEIAGSTVPDVSPEGRKHDRSTCLAV